VDVEPALADLGEGGLDDLLELADPPLLAGVELDLGNA